MARQINAEHVQRGDLPSIPPPEIVVVHSDNTRLYKPDVSDLVEDMLVHGQLQACVVRPLPDKKVRLVCGFRRWLAGMQIWQQQEAAGVPPEDRFKLKVEVQIISPEQALERNVIENARRKNLSPIESAHAISRLRVERGWGEGDGDQKLAHTFCRSVSWIREVEELLLLNEAERYQVHRYWETDGQDGLSPTNAKILVSVPEEQREKVLQDAREASMHGRENIPEGKINGNGVGESDGKKPKKTSGKKREGNAVIKAKDLANAAAKNGADGGKVRNRQASEWLEFLRSYETSEALRPLHPITKELIKRCLGFWDRSVDEDKIDRHLIKIDDLCYEFWSDFQTRKRDGKLKSAPAKVGRSSSGD